MNAHVILRRNTTLPISTDEGNAHKYIFSNAGDFAEEENSKDASGDTKSRSNTSTEFKESNVVRYKSGVEGYTNYEVRSWKTYYRRARPRLTPLTWRGTWYLYQIYISTPLLPLGRVFRLNRRTIFFLPVSLPFTLPRPHLLGSQISSQSLFVLQSNHCYPKSCYQITIP